ncbi:hypothetical protein EAX61_02535 [Dokdonia sinensis]|uniref:Uncharacterized protein n=1 Tax=Dokdonia sinensis TaxID=2479847 RepID=A0A3M0GFL0_9FLAO|nr:hypothetical protein [Dokdonia sinensis]RMB63287.1 hypothetical protein EAX61_02535 [Dokdonia sinensis]
MLQRIKIETFSQAYINAEKTASKSVDWSKVFYILQCVLLFAFPIGAIALSIANDYLFLNEILSGTFLLTLILIVKIAGGKS